MAVLLWTENNGLGSGNFWFPFASANGDLYTAEEVWSGAYTHPVVRSTDDGDTWAPVTSIPTTMESYGMGVKANGEIVLVGNGLGGTTAMYHKSSGGAWTAGVMPSVGPWWNAAHNGVNFCAVKTNGAATSANGTAWTARVMNLPGTFGSICAVGATFVAVARGDDKARRSIDNGVSWTEHTMPSSGWEAIATDGTRVIACGTDKFAYSDDGGQTWTQVPVTGNWSEIAYNGTLWCAIADNSNKFATAASGGAAWVTDTLPETIFAENMGVHDGNFIIVNWNSIFVSAPGFVEFWTNEVGAQET